MEWTQAATNVENGTASARVLGRFYEQTACLFIVRPSSEYVTSALAVRHGKAHELSISHSDVPRRHVPRRRSVRRRRLFVGAGACVHARSADDEESELLCGGLSRPRRCRPSPPCLGILRRRPALYQGQCRAALRCCDGHLRQRLFRRQASTVCAPPRSFAGGRGGSPSRMRQHARLPRRQGRWLCTPKRHQCWIHAARPSFSVLAAWGAVGGSTNDDVMREPLCSRRYWLGS